MCIRFFKFQYEHVRLVKTRNYIFNRDDQVMFWAETLIRNV